MKLHMPDPLPQIPILKGVNGGAMGIFNELPGCLLCGLGRRFENHRSGQYLGVIVSDVSNDKQLS